MSATSSPAATRRPDGRLVQSCDLVDRAIAADLRVVPEGDATAASPLLVPGWALVGHTDGDRLEAAAETIRRLYRNEEEIRALCTEVLGRYEEVTLVYRLSDRLGSVLGHGDIAALVLDEAARVLGARGGGIWLEVEGRPERVATFPVGAVTNEPKHADVIDALHDRKPRVTDAAPGSESTVAVPLPDSDGEPLGLLALWGRSGGRSYRTGEVKLLAAIATLTSAFIRNDRLAAEARRTEARKREDEIARQVHRGLLPHEEPDFRGLEISGCCRAAENVGGDYYGYIPMPDGGLGLVMADVSGHGVGAALYMAAAKGALQAEARRILSPAELLRRSNEALVGDFSRSDVFATAFFARFHPGGRHFEFANGGHNPPLLVRVDGSVETMEPGGPALGLLPAMHYHEESRWLEPGDVVVVYTDGLVEARGEDRQLFGFDRLRETAVRHRSSSARALRDRLLETVADHRGGKPTHDDVTLVVVRATETQPEDPRGAHQP